MSNPALQERSRLAWARDRAGLVGLPPAIANLLVARLLSSAGYYGLIPFLVVVLVDEYRYSTEAAAFLVGGMIVGSRVATLPVGLVSDRLGWQRLLVLGTLGSAVALGGIAALPPHLNGLVVLAAAVASLGSAGQFIGFNIAVPRVLERDDLPRGYALLGTMFNLGAIIGPPVAALFLRGADYRQMVLFSVLFYGAAGILILRAKVAETPLETPPAEDAEANHARMALGMALSFLILFICTWALLQQITIGFAKYFDDFFGAASYAPLFFVLQAALVIPLLPVAGSAMRGWGVRRMFVSYGLGTLLIPLAFLLLAAVPENAPLVAVGMLVAVITLSELLSVPAASAFVARVVPPARHGGAFGVLGAMQAVGFGLGTIVGASALAYAEPNLPAYWVVVSAVFGGLAVAAFAVGLATLRRWPELALSRADGDAA